MCMRPFRRIALIAEAIRNIRTNIAPLYQTSWNNSWCSKYVIDKFFNSSPVYFRPTFPRNGPRHFIVRAICEKSKNYLLIFHRFKDINSLKIFTVNGSRHRIQNIMSLISMKMSPQSLASKNPAAHKNTVY